MAGGGPRNVLRHLAHRHRSCGSLLSRHGGWRRPAADAALRAALAAALSRRAARNRTDPPRRLVRPALLPRRAAPTNVDTNGMRVPRLPAGVLSAAAPELAQQGLAQGEPLVRNGCHPGAQAAR